MCTFSVLNSAISSDSNTPYKEKTITAGQCPGDVSDAILGPYPLHYNKPKTLSVILVCCLRADSKEHSEEGIICFLDHCNLHWWQIGGWWWWHIQKPPPLL